MDIGEQERVIVVEPLPLPVPPAPVEPVPEPAQLPAGRSSNSDRGE